MTKYDAVLPVGSTEEEKNHQAITEINVPV